MVAKHVLHASKMTIEITKATPADFDIIWQIFQPIIQAGGTYVYRPDISKEEAYTIWFDETYNTYLAKDGDEVIGAYVIRPGHRDLGSHISNAAYIVPNKYRGKGYGEMLGKHSIEQARRLGYVSGTKQRRSAVRTGRKTQTCTKESKSGCG